MWTMKGNNGQDVMEEQVRSADDSIRLIIDNLLRKGNQFAIEYDDTCLSKSSRISLKRNNS